MLGPRTSIEYLKRYFAGKLIRARKPDHGENAFNELALNSRTQRNSRSKDEDVDPQAPVTKRIFYLEDEVSLHKISHALEK